MSRLAARGAGVIDTLASGIGVGARVSMLAAIGSGEGVAPNITAGAATAAERLRGEPASTFASAFTSGSIVLEATSDALCSTEIVPSAEIAGGISSIVIAAGEPASTSTFTADVITGSFQPKTAERAGTITVTF